MKIYKKLTIISLILGIFFVFAGSASASIPTLSLISIGGTDSVTVNVTGDYNSNVILYYSSASTLQNRIIGTTSNIGYLSATVSANSLGITPGTSVYVVINNQQSPSVTWPYSAYSSSTLSLSQTSLSLSPGQTSTVTVLNNYSSIYNYNNYNYGTFYISNNSNPSVATATVSNNIVSVYGSSIGVSLITVCQNGVAVSPVCGTIYANVVAGTYPNNYNYNNNYNTGYNSTNTFGLNISSLTLANRSSITISSSNPAGMYVSNNSNPNVASTSYSLSNSSVCTGGALYNILTGQPCSSYYSGSNSYVPGCTAGAQYSTFTGQPCFGSSATSNTSVTISALSVGSDTITLCQNSGNACSDIFISVVY